MHPADDFPQDDSGYGFDNIGDVLSLSPVLMEKYFAAAEKVDARGALRSAEAGADADTPALGRPPSVATRRRSRRRTTSPGLSLPNAFHAIYRVPVDGEYVIRVVLGGTRPAGVGAGHRGPVGRRAPGRSTRVHDPDRAATFSDDRQDFGGQTTEFRVKLTAGDHRLAVAIPRIYEGLPARYDGPNPSTRPEPPRKAFKPPPDASPERIEQLAKSVRRDAGGAARRFR